LKTLKIKGQITTGKGEGTKFTTLPWAQKQIAEKTGFAPYPGTLNIITTQNRDKIKQLKTATAAEISPPTGFYLGKLFKATIANTTCAVIIPETPSYPDNLLEVVAPTNLREKLHLKDGDIIEIEIFLE